MTNLSRTRLVMYQVQRVSLQSAGTHLSFVRAEQSRLTSWPCSMAISKQSQTALKTPVQATPGTITDHYQ